MTYYTIFLGKKPWENVIDDMNSLESWGFGAMFWSEESKALDCMKYLKNPVYGFENNDSKFAVVKFEINYLDEELR